MTADVAASKCMEMSRELAQMDAEVLRNLTETLLAQLADKNSQIIEQVAMKPRRYKLALSDGAYGPGDIGEITVADGGLIVGPDLPNWPRESLLVTCLDPTTYRGELLKYLVLSARYTKDSIETIRKAGGIVGVARFLPSSYTEKPRHFESGQVEYWFIGTLSPLGQ